jgi:hypothetical protein
MAREVAKLVTMDPGQLGLLDISAYQRSVDLMMAYQEGGPALNRQHRNAWSHELWGDAVGEEIALFDRKTLYYFELETGQSWFYWTVLFGAGQRASIRYLGCACPDSPARRGWRDIA